MNNINIWSIVKFGKYDWLVLEKRDDSILLITKNIIERRAYHGVRTEKDMTWENSDLRKYLNLIFLNSFSPEERSRIRLTHNKNNANPEFGTNGGNDTDDYIFLLSIEEAQALDYRAATYGDDAYWWWLRSPGCVDIDGAGINADGSISIGGLDKYRVDGGLRPALWLSL